MGEVKRFYVQWPTAKRGELNLAVLEADYARLERERDQAMAAHADMVREIEASQAEFTRLRAVEARYCYLRAQLQVTRNAAVPDCISLEYIRAEETEPDDADYIDAYIDRQLRALAEACGRKG